MAPQWLARLTARLTDWEDWLTLVARARRDPQRLGGAGAVRVVGEHAADHDRIGTRHRGLVVGRAVRALDAGRLADSRARRRAWSSSGKRWSSSGPGNLEQRLDAIYFRFETWFDLAFNGGVSNDSLPFNVLVLSLTWLGVFLFGWSVFRWQNAWIGLIPGGVALFLDMALIGDDLAGAVLLYMLFGFLLVMRTNLMARMAGLAARGHDLSTADEPYVPQLQHLGC